MNRKRLVILLVFGLLVGTVGRVPVARAAVVHYDYTNAPVQLDISGVYPDITVKWYQQPQASAFSAIPTQTYSVTIDGVATTAYSGGFLFLAAPSFDKVAAYGKTGNDVRDVNRHYVQIACSASWEYSGTTYYWTWNWYGTALTHSGTGFWSGNPEAETIEALTVAVSGPSAVDTTIGGTWTAEGAGGEPPYTYGWTYGVTGPFATHPHAGSSYTLVLPAGTWMVECQVTDADDDTATDSIAVFSSDMVANIHIVLQRVGSVGQFVEATAWDAAGQAVEITGTSETSVGVWRLGLFEWDVSSEALQVVASLMWRYQVVSDEHMWFKSTIAVTGGHSCAVIVEFNGRSEIVDAYLGGDDAQIDAPTPPEAEEAQSILLTVIKTFGRWLLDELEKLFVKLFVPTSSDFSAQLASGWILIDSPVPSITPQYTLPFPNPNHLLSPTGDSVNIDFSGIQAYAGYSTYKTIVQLVLDAILVFIVISLVT
jgi:hypothetical protein